MAKKSSKKTTVQPRERGAKTQWIKDYLAKHPDAKLREVSEASEAAGMGKVQHVQFVTAGGQVKARGSTSAKKRKGDSNSAIMAAAQLLKAAGGIKEAQAVLEQVASIVSALRDEKVPF